MLKKYKQLVIGFVIGASLFSVMPVKAAIEDLRIYLNPYPVVVNGTSQAVDGYNINDYTYLKLADIAKVLNTDIKFNENTSKIEVTTNKNTIVSAPSSVITPTPTATPQPISYTGKITFVPGKDVDSFLVKFDSPVSNPGFVKFSVTPSLSDTRDLISTVTNDGLTAYIFANYTHISPGTYTLYINVTDSNGLSSAKEFGSIEVK